MSTPRKALFTTIGKMSAKSAKKEKKSEKRTSFLSIPVDLWNYLLYNTIYKIFIVFSQTTYTMSDKYTKEGGP